nr:hypothetical protein BdHM001_35190 [Bdellovibrio sp. HM001]
MQIERKSLKEIQSRFISERITPNIKPWLDFEMFYLKCRSNEADYMLSMIKSGKKYKNDCHSAVAFVTGMTDEEPKRKVDTALGSLPDIDYDSSGRDKMVEALIEKFGRDRVGLIGTYSALKTKGALKDVSRALLPDHWDHKNQRALEPEAINTLSKGFDIHKRADFDSEIQYYEACLKDNPVLAKFFEEFPRVDEAIRKIIGNNKNRGIHASGVVISPIPLIDICPMDYDDASKLYVTQPEMKSVEALGLIKFDFLGLTTLEVFRECLKLIKENRGFDLDLKSINLQDQKVLARFNAGETEGVFQYNTPTATKGLTRLYKPITTVEVMSIITALYRPGPMNSGLTDVFTRRFNGEEEVSFDHPLLEPILKGTYGLMVYQEQIMETFVNVGGMSGSDGYNLIKSISKKDKAKIESYMEKFKKGAAKNGVPSQTIEKIWDTIVAFADYGFNKSHSMCYAITGYTSMWLKTYYPQEFMTAYLSFASKDEFQDLYPVWNDVITPPQVNASSNKYVLKDGKAYMPISEIAKIGEEAASSIEKAYPFRSFQDFLECADASDGERAIKVNKTAMKNLIFAGYFDPFMKTGLSTAQKYASRLEYYERYIAFQFGLEPRTPEERAAGVALSSQKKRPSKALLALEADLNAMKNQGALGLLRHELELINISSFNYYEYFREKIPQWEEKRSAPIQRLADFDEIGDGEEFSAIACFKEMRLLFVKSGPNKGQPWAIIKVIEGSREVSVSVFSKHFAKDKDLLQTLTPMTPVIIMGKKNYWGDPPVASLAYSGITIIK